MFLTCVWGHSYQCIHFFGCKIAVNSAFFTYFAHLYRGGLKKSIKKQYITYRGFVFNSVSTSKQV